MEQLESAISAFAGTISKEDLELVDHRPDSNASATNCMANVLSFVRTNGGNIAYGWTFNHRTSIEFGDYIFSTHHAVWHNPHGLFVDITPFHEDTKHHPITKNEKVLLALWSMLIFS